MPDKRPGTNCYSVISNQKVKNPSFAATCCWLLFSVFITVRGRAQPSYPDAKMNRGSFGSLHWKFQTGGKIFSSPAISGGTAFVGSEDKNLYAVDIKSGKLRWKFPTGGAVHSSPAVFKNVVYFGSYDGYYYALEENSGKLIWKFKTGGEKKVGAIGLWTMKPSDEYMEDLYDFFLSSPLIDQNETDPTIYFGSSDGNLYALKARDGSLKWKFKTNGIIHTSPALYGGKVYIGSWDTYLYAVDARTGNEIWKFKTGEQPEYHVMEGIQSSPTPYKGRIYFGSRDGNFYALDAQTGGLKWKYAADNSWVLTTAAAKNGLIYIGTSDTFLFLALDAETGKEKYRLQTNGYIYSSPSLSGNAAYFGDFTGKLFAVNLDSEGKIWDEFVTDGSKKNATKILNKKGKLDFNYAATGMDPSLYSSTVAVMNRFYEMGSIVSTAAISGNAIFFGSADGCLYSLGLR
jgi:outer membrane protein assembly factor BamB